MYLVILGIPVIDFGNTSYQFQEDWLSILAKLVIDWDTGYGFRWYWLSILKFLRVGQFEGEIEHSKYMWVLKNVLKLKKGLLYNLSYYKMIKM